MMMTNNTPFASVLKFLALSFITLSLPSHAVVVSTKSYDLKY